MVRMLPEAVRKGEFRRKALTPMADGRSRWEYPTTFLMEHPTGYWQFIAVPLLEEKVSRSTWKAFLGVVPKRLDAGGRDEQQAEITQSDSRVPDSDYPAGQPLSETEQKACRNHRPKSLSDGKYLCWNFPSHAGCRSPGNIFPRGKHEIIKTAGLHTLIQMQLARRGGHLAGKKIQPRNVDGHVQALRLQLMSNDLDTPQWKPRWKKKEDKVAGGELLQRTAVEEEDDKKSAEDVTQTIYLPQGSSETVGVSKVITFFPDTSENEKPDYPSGRNP